jgi:hypothetical protein
MIRLNNLLPYFKFGRTQKKSVKKQIEDEAKNAIISELDDRCLFSLEGTDARKLL